MVDFPTRGVASLNNVFTNRPDLFGKCTPYCISIKRIIRRLFSHGNKTQARAPNSSHSGYHCRKHKKEALYLELASETWESVFRTADVDEAVNILETLIHNYMDRCMPFRTVCMSSRAPAWMTPIVKSLMRAKSRIGPNNVARLREINRRISELISKNRRNFLQAPIGTREWWKHVDNLSQRRYRSAKVTLDKQSPYDPGIYNYFRLDQMIYLFKCGKTKQIFLLL